jgi:hypothetical protein
MMAVKKEMLQQSSPHRHTNVNSYSHIKLYPEKLRKLHFWKYLGLDHIPVTKHQ